MDGTAKTVAWAAYTAAVGASVYHGYKRNQADNPIFWALMWGVAGSIVPVITVPVAIAQGFGEPSSPQLKASV